MFESRRRPKADDFGAGPPAENYRRRGKSSTFAWSFSFGGSLLSSPTAPQESAAARGGQQATPRRRSLARDYIIQRQPSMLGLWLFVVLKALGATVVSHNLLTNSSGARERSLQEPTRKSEPRRPVTGAAWVRRDAAAALLEPQGLRGYWGSSRSRTLLCRVRGRAAAPLERQRRAHKAAPRPRTLQPCGPAPARCSPRCGPRASPQSSERGLLP